MTDVNLTVGRFQPFTKGHLQMCKDGYDKNGLPVVVFLVDNKKFDTRHPFSNDLVLKELEIVKKNNSFITDIFIVSKANIVEMGETLKEHGYSAHLWLCGEDREEKYRTTQITKKYIEWGGYPEDFTTYTGSGRVEGVSGTAVREAVKSGDEKTFKKLMPKGTEKLFKEFQSELSKVQESEDRQGLSDFVVEAISSGAFTRAKAENKRDPFVPIDKGDLIREISKCIAEDGYACNLNHIDVSEIEDFADLFYNFPDFNGDISDWDMSSAITTRCMFYASKYTGQNGDISDWNMRSVKYAGRMFYGSKYDGDISRWDLRSLDIRNSQQMIANCPLAKNRKHWPKRFR